MPDHWPLLVNSVPHISRGSAAIRLRRGRIFNDDFTAEFEGERISKIGYHLAKLRARVLRIFVD